jgi:hypothetical protein
VHKTQAAEEKRAQETEADAKKETEEKHEAHHTKKASTAHHAHHAHHAQTKAKQVRVNQHHNDHHAHQMAEALGWTPESTAEAEDRKREADEAHEEEQREKMANGQQRVGATTYAATAANKAQAGHDNKKDGFQKPNTGQSKPQLNTKTAEPPPAVSAAKTVDAARAAAERMLASGKPLDAFALLQRAEPAGVLFKENDSGNAFEAPAPEDPELAKAIEELVSKLFGVKGILRVGGGRNKDDEPVVVVAVGNGFGEASLKAVPEKAGKFSTLIALPYDILPLKKER